MNDTPADSLSRGLRHGRSNYKTLAAEFLSTGCPSKFDSGEMLKNSPAKSYDTVRHQLARRSHKYDSGRRSRRPIPTVPRTCAASRSRAAEESPHRQTDRTGDRILAEVSRYGHHVVMAISSRCGRTCACQADVASCKWHDHDAAEQARSIYVYGLYRWRTDHEEAEVNRSVLTGAVNMSPTRDVWRWFTCGAKQC